MKHLLIISASCLLMLNGNTQCKGEYDVEDSPVSKNNRMAPWYTHRIKNETNTDVEVILTYQKPDSSFHDPCDRASHTIIKNTTLTVGSPCRLANIRVRCKGHKDILKKAHDDSKCQMKGTSWTYRSTIKEPELVQTCGRQEKFNHGY